MRKYVRLRACVRRHLMLTKYTAGVQPLCYPDKFPAPKRGFPLASKLSVCLPVSRPEDSGEVAGFGDDGRPGGGVGGGDRWKGAKPLYGDTRGYQKTRVDGQVVCLVDGRGNGHPAGWLSGRFWRGCHTKEDERRRSRRHRGASN